MAKLEKAIGFGAPCFRSLQPVIQLDRPPSLHPPARHLDGVVPGTPCYHVWCCNAICHKQSDLQPIWMGHLDLFDCNDSSNVAMILEAEPFSF